MLPGKQGHGAFFLTRTQKASKCKLYSLKTKPQGESFSLTEFLTTKSFAHLLGREVQQKRQTSTNWWKCKNGNKWCSLTLLTKRSQKWLDSSTTRTEQWLLTVGWRRSLMTKVETIASYWKLARFSLVRLIFYETEGPLRQRV